MEGLLGWVISPMPGPPPRQHKHERQYTPSTHSVIPKRRIWNDDDDGQMVFGDLGGLEFPDICLSDEEKPRKNVTQETCPDRGSNPGPLRDKRAFYHSLHSGGRHINQSINQSQCSAQGQVFHCKLIILHSTLFSDFLFVSSYSPFIIMLSINWYLLLPGT